MSDRPQDWQQAAPAIPRPDPMTTSRQEPVAIPSIELRDYFEMRITAVEEKATMRVEALGKELAVAMRGSAEAISKAEAATEKRFDSVNEFRQTLSDQAATFASRASFDSLEAALVAKIEALSNTQATEIRGLRDTLLAKIEMVAAAAQIRIEAERASNASENKAMWKVIYGLATAVAVIQAIIQFSPK